MSLGAVLLKIIDIDTVSSFYRNEMGLRVLREVEGEKTPAIELAASGVNEPLIILQHDPNMQRPPHNAAGLYHFAILVPSKRDLAAAYLGLGNSGLAFDGFADHLVSEALYLTDPEGNGIEIYTDRPRSQWRFESGRLVMDTRPLDIDSLLLELKGSKPNNLPAIASMSRIGHVHLKVTDIAKSVEFYGNKLGLDLTCDWASAAFLSAGGYHHHIGMNTWESLNGPTITQIYAGLDYFTIQVSEKKFLDAIARRLDPASLISREEEEIIARDPNGIRFVIRTK